VILVAGVHRKDVRFCGLFLAALQGVLMFRRKMGVIFVVAGLIAVLTACSPGSGSKPTPTPLPPVLNYEKTIFKVEKGSIVSEKKVSADIVPSKQDDLFFRASGFINRVVVKQGDKVKKGDVLAEMQVDDLLNQLQQARIDLEVAQANMEKDKSQKLFELKKANSDVYVLQKKVELAKLALVDANDAETKKAQIYVDMAEADLALAQQNLELLSNESSTYMEQAVKRNELAVQRLEGMLTERQITAPYDGVILKSNIRPGQQVDAFFIVLSIGDPTDLVIRAQPDEELSKSLTQGSTAKLLIKADLKDGYDVAYLPDFVPLTTTTETKSTVMTLDYIYFALPKDVPAAQVSVGRNVYLNVILGKKDNVLMLPPAAIREYKGLKFVIVQEGDKRRRVEINEIGLKSTDKWEVIAADLREGDQVQGP
jgi:multidrug efflux pump subunit AcrA (membrane-fusion protein)